MINNIETSDVCGYKQWFKEWFLVSRIKLVSIWSLAYIYIYNTQKLVSLSNFIKYFSIVKLISF